MSIYSETCEKAAREAGRILREMQGTVSVRHKKNRFDLVTEADIAAQKAIEEILFSTFPEHRLIGEEGNLTQSSSQNNDSEYCWLVDPLDGTTNFVHGFPMFCTSIALARKNELLCSVVYNPITEEFFSAEQGQGAFLNGKRLQTSSFETLAESLVSVSFPTVTTSESPDLVTFLKAISRCQAIRRTGSTALNLAYVAAGRFEASWAFKPHPWDVAAGTLLIREAGGLVTKPDGSPLDFYADPVEICAVANRSIQYEVLTMLDN